MVKFDAFSKVAMQEEIGISSREKQFDPVLEGWSKVEDGDIDPWFAMLLTNRDAVAD